MRGLLPAESWRRDPRAGVLVIVAGVSVAGFVALSIGLLVAPAFAEVDEAVSSAIRLVSVPGSFAAARFFSWIGDFWPMTVLTLVTAAALWAKGRRSEALLVIVTVAVGVALGHGVKLVVQRVRPALEHARIAIPGTYAFPSGHALASTLYFGIVGFVVALTERRLRHSALVVGACLAIAVLVGLSRVYLGVHYLGDVVGAWLLGAAWLATMVLVGASWGAGRPERP